MYKYMYILNHTSTYECVYMYIHIYIYKYIYMYINIFMYRHIYVHSYSSTRYKSQTLLSHLTTLQTHPRIC